MSTDQAVVDAVRDAGVGVASTVSRLPIGMSNSVYDVVLRDGGRLIARVASVAKNRYAMESGVMERVRFAGIPCPEVYAIQVIGDLAVMLIEHLDGLRLAEVPRPAGLARRCGELLARVHSIQVRGFGSLTNSGEGEAESLERWFVDDFESSFAQAAEAGQGEVRTIVGQIRAELESARPIFRSASCALVHGDFSPSNILVKDGEISGVIDWESAKAGPPGFDFGWWDWFANALPVPFSCDELVASYAVHRRVDVEELREMRRLVVMRILIGQVAWAAVAISGLSWK